MADEAQPNHLAKLKALLRQRAAQTAESAVRNGTASHEETQALQDLVTLCSVLEATGEKHKLRVAPAIMFLLAMVCASMLLFFRVRSSEVELKVSATSTTFQLAEARQLVMNEPSLREIRIGRIHEISAIPCSGVETHRRIRSLAVAVEPGRDAGAITLGAIEGSAGLGLTLRATEAPAVWDMEFNDVPVTLSLRLEGAVRIENQLCHFEGLVPMVVTIAMEKTGARLNFELVRPGDRLFPVLLPVKALSFRESELLRIGGKQTHAERSTLMGGSSLFYEDLSGKEEKLREGERLDVNVEHGWLQLPQKSGSVLDSRFRGSLTLLVSGPPDAPRDLKPSWLDYVRAQHGLELMWGTAISLFGLAGTLLQWWKIRQ
jgi:hypothetical protein